MGPAPSRPAVFPPPPPTPSPAPPPPEPDPYVAVIKKNPTFANLMDKDRLTAFLQKDEKGVFRYKKFENDLNDAKTLEYRFPDLVEAKKISTKADILDIQKNAKKDISRLNIAHRKDKSNKDDADDSLVEVLLLEIDNIKVNLNKAKEISNDIETEEVILLSTSLIEAQSNLRSTYKKQENDMIELDIEFQADIAQVDDIARDDIRRCKTLEKMYKMTLTNKLKSAIDEINKIYPTKELGMDPPIEVSTDGEPTIILPQEVIVFIKNKMISIKPKPNLSRKFGIVFEDEKEREVNEEKEIVRMETLAKKITERRAADKKKKAIEDAEKKRIEDAEKKRADFFKK